jgi:ABC-type branched-subunit amino acid transport system ATPase component
VNRFRRRRPKPTVPLLEARDVAKSFSAVKAVNGVSLCLHEGEILGIIGPNGSGKTTLLDILSGFLVPDAGSVIYQGENITASGPERRARLGIGRSFQDAALFGALTVHQTIVVALDRHIAVKNPLSDAFYAGAALRTERWAADRADSLIELFRIGDFRDKFVSELSTGSRRVVDLACQLALEPRVILLDEPSAGIAQRETEALGPLLRRIRDDTGASLLVVDHDISLVREISDRVIVLHLGQEIAGGSPGRVLRNRQVRACYFGVPDVESRNGQLGVLRAGFD